jgi:putative transposase
LGGRRVPARRPRVRAAYGAGELHLPSRDLFPSTEILGRMALEKMLTGLSSRRYGHGLEPAGRARPALVVPPVHHRVTDVLRHRGKP